MSGGGVRRRVNRELKLRGRLQLQGSDDDVMENLLALLLALGLTIEYSLL